jgi:predicted nucleic acid-binding Zn ribbon protein
MSKRGGDPSSIADVLRSFLGRGKIAARLGQTEVLGIWPEIVGAQIASVTEARSVTEDGTLLVHVRTHPWMTELSLREPEILTAIRERMPGTGIKRIRFLAWR